jgi:predicted MFS family arabinose efflux permease
VAVAGLLALAVAIGIGRFAFTPLLPMMQDDAGLSVPAGGWLASANYAGYLLGALSAMVMRVRAATAIRGGLVVIGFATVAMGYENRFPAWAVLRALAGIASAWVLIHVSAWSLERLAPFGRPRLAGVVFGGVGAGIACVGLICIVLMRAAVGSALAWVAFGMISLVITAATWQMFATPGETTPRSAAQHGDGAPGRTAGAARLVFAYAALGFGYIIPATFLPAMAREVIHDPAIFGWSWPVFGLAAAASTIFATMLPESAGNRRLLIASLLVMAIGVALPVFVPGIPGILLAALLVGGTFMIATMAGLKEARESSGGHATRLMAAMTAAFAFGQIAGPASVSTMLAAGAAVSTALFIASCLLAIGACVLVPVGAARLPGRCRTSREKKAK